MSRYAFVNGSYKWMPKATVHVEDRGYQFADGVYEVCLVVDGALWDSEGHLKRWQRSLDALEIAPPIASRAILPIAGALMRKNRLRDALIYMQATRGAAPRNHVFPSEGAIPSFVMTARRFSLEASDALAKEGVRAVTQPDIRWTRADIKSISLLPNVLAKDEARRAGGVEAILVRNDVVTEGASSNIWIVDKSGNLRTHPRTNIILGGITRENTLACAESLQISVIEEPFSPTEMLSAREVFMTAATNLVMPITHIDGKPIGAGKVGPIAKRLRSSYLDAAKRSAVPLLKQLQ